MASDEEDDYLSAKFLLDTTSSAKAQTYAERRRQAQKESQLKNEQNRIKSRKQRQLDAREEGLSKSLFERAQEDASAGRGNKAMSLMAKMGFKPGMTLGVPNAVTEEPEKSSATSTAAVPGTKSPTPERRLSQPPSLDAPQHRAEPLPLNEWTGKKGIGLGLKRPLSPGAIETLAKKAKHTDEHGRDDFRERARQEYEERQAGIRILHAIKTCQALDDKAGVQFNYLWLNPHEMESFPPGLWEALTENSYASTSGTSEAVRLRQQMQADALLPLRDTDDMPLEAKSSSANSTWPSDTIEEAARFLHLDVQDRLEELLSYLRETHCYCFWCGTQYVDAQELRDQCPGSEEALHD